MTKTIKLALVAAMAMGATSAFATNGDNLIGLGAKSRAMGGTGIAHFNGAESATANPALIVKSKGTAFAFGATYFRPDVEISTDGPSISTGGTPTSRSYDSDAENNVIPYVALVENMGDGWAIGASMFGSAGMGVDYRSTGPSAMGGVVNGAVQTGGMGGLPPELNLEGIPSSSLAMFGPQIENTNNVGTTGTGAGMYSMRTNLLLLKFSVPIAYGQDNWSVGIAPVMMYGSLDMSMDMPNSEVKDFSDLGMGQQQVFTGGSHDVGNGSSSDFGIGFELGGAYTLTDIGLTLGATYHSSIEMEYSDQISTLAHEFGYAPGVLDNRLEQPAEYGLGVDWTEGDLSLTMDWKNIRWASARGYEDFGWENQDVFAFGAEYRMDDLSLRAGFNYAANPIQSQADTRINLLNQGMFPAVTQRHYTLGAGYQFTKNVAVDGAFTYGQSGDITSDAGQFAGSTTTTNDQYGLSLAINYTF